MTERRETHSAYYAVTLETMSEDQREAKNRFDEAIGQEWKLDVDGGLVTLRLGDDIRPWMARVTAAEKDLLDLRAWVKERTQMDLASDWAELRDQLGIKP